MKDAFRTANKKIRLFGQQAAIMRLAFADTGITVTAGGCIDGADDLSVLAAQDSLLSYLEEEALKFETLLHSDTEIVLAVAAGEEVYAKKMIDAFIAENPVPSLISVIVQPAQGATLKNRLLNPLSKMGRDVARACKNL